MYLYTRFYVTSLKYRRHALHKDFPCTMSKYRSITNSWYMTHHLSIRCIHIWPGLVFLGCIEDIIQLYMSSTSLHQLVNTCKHTTSLMVVTRFYSQIRYQLSVGSYNMLKHEKDHITCYLFMMDCVICTIVYRHGLSYMTRNKLDSVNLNIKVK